MLPTSMAVLLLLQSTVILPGASLEAAIVTLARASGVPIGFEAAQSAPHETVALATPLDVRNQDPRVIVDRLLGHNTRYRWRESGGALEVRPLTPDGRPQLTLLDRPIDALTLTNMTLPSALDVVLKMYAPVGFRGAPRARFGPSPQMLRSFSVHVEQTTVAGLLTQIVIEHGAAGWLVTYHAIDGNRGVADPSIEVFTFDGRQFGQSVPMQSQ